ncbi:MAG: F0F1 ATP synthase subunit B [Patescibacteria group bacterium]|nr:F0F1 ATP synthase subunit B [Patescibacteria group bacterium]MDE2590553.1 F0F1 ATP synthase subunit B [Patescibacteria group bacterium]
MDLIKNFGIQPTLLLAQVVNFLIILWLLQKFAFKPIMKMLGDRKKTIAEGIKNAEDARAALEKAVEEEKKVLKKAQTEAQIILADARKQADETIAASRDEAKVQVEHMLADAKSKMEQDSRETEKRLALSAAKLAVDMLEKSLSGVFDAKEQEEAVQKLTVKLKKQ